MSDRQLLVPGGALDIPARVSPSRTPPRMFAAAGSTAMDPFPQPNACGGALNMMYRMYRALASVLMLVALVPPVAAVTITFETRPDGTPIQNVLGCGEVAFDTFRPWGVVLNPPEGDTLDIRTTLSECLSGPNALGLCSQNGTIVVTFVLPGTNTSVMVDGIDMALLTATTLPWQGEVRVYDEQGMLLDVWALTSAGFCREPPAYYNLYHFSAPGRIARVECFLRRVGIDDLIVTEATTPAEGSTWGAIKSTFK